MKTSEYLEIDLNIYGESILRIKEDFFTGKIDFETYNAGITYFTNMIELTKKQIVTSLKQENYEI